MRLEWAALPIAPTWTVGDDVGVGALANGAALCAECVGALFDEGAVDLDSHGCTWRVPSTASEVYGPAGAIRHCPSRFEPLPTFSTRPRLACRAKAIVTLEAKSLCSRFVTKTSCRLRTM